MPSDAAVTCSMMPQPTPATAATPPRKPSCVERATISAVSGPGVTLSSQPAKMKIRRSCVPSIYLCRPRSAEAGAVVRRGEVELRTERHDAGRVHLALAPVIVMLDLIEAHHLGDAGHLVEIAQVVRQVRILVDVPPVAFEVRIVDGVEADQRHEEAPVGLGDL